MTQPTHTPTPYEVHEGDDYLEIFHAHDDTPQSYYRKVAIIMHPDEEDAKTAAFITRACNAHEELVEKLAALLEQVNSNPEPLGCNPAKFQAARLAAVAALAKATEA